MNNTANKTNRPDPAIRNNAAKAAKAAFDANVRNVANRFVPGIQTIQVIVHGPDIVVTGSKTDVWTQIGRKVRPGRYGATVTNGDNTVLVDITVNKDKTVIRTISHWTR
jgi:hypothetical protein